MLSASRKSIKRFGITAGAAALFLSLIPGQAFAINQVPCDRDDFVHVWWHTDFGGGESCFANAGNMPVADGNYVWVDKVSSGNNDVIFLAVSGENQYFQVIVQRNRVESYDYPFYTKQIYIA